jgi:hypothetical protein
MFWSRVAPSHQRLRSVEQIAGVREFRSSADTEPQVASKVDFPPLTARPSGAAGSEEKPDRPRLRCLAGVRD